MTRTAILTTAAAALTMLTVATASACMPPPPMTPGRPSAATQPSEQSTIVQISNKCRWFERYWICE